MTDQNALTNHETSTQALALVPTSLDGAMQLARWLSSAKFLPEALRGKEADIFTMVIAGLELGLPPMAALRGMYIVNGKPSLESKTKAALCLQKSAAVYFKRTEHTADATTWETKRRDTGEISTMRYTREQAKEAGLLTKAGPWSNYAQRMISHRALGWLCDDAYPDVMLGIGTAEDRFDVDAIDADFVEDRTGFGALPNAPADPAPAAFAKAREAAKELEESRREAAKAKLEIVGDATDAKEGLEKVADAIADLPDAETAPSSPPATDGPKLLTEEEVAELTGELFKAESVESLKAIATRIAKLPIGQVHKDALSKTYKACLATLQAKAKSAGAAA